MPTEPGHAPSQHQTESDGAAPKSPNRDGRLRVAARVVLTKPLDFLPQHAANTVRRLILSRVRSHLPSRAFVSKNDVVAQIGTPRIATVEALLRQSRPNGKVLVVEASSGNYNHLKAASQQLERRDRERLILVHAAAHDRHCTLDLELSDDFAGDNFVRIDGIEVDNEAREGGEFSKTESVEALPLDAIVEKNGLRLDVLICTVNGAELAVLRGAHTTIASMGPQSRAFIKTHARLDGESIYAPCARILRESGFVCTKTKPKPSPSGAFGTRSGDLFAYKT